MSEHPPPVHPVHPQSCCDAVHDRLVHFSACIKFEDRAEFLQNAPEPLRQRIEHMLSRNEYVRHRIETQAEGDFWVTRLGDHMSYFRHHRQARQPRPTPSVVSGGRASSSGSLQKAVRATAQRLGVSHQTEFLSAPTLTSRGCGEKPGAGRETKSVYKGVNAGVVYFQNGLPYSHPKAAGSFPNQTLPVAELLSHQAGSSLLMEPCKDGMIRWFHLPANNMAWVEASVKSGRQGLVPTDRSIPRKPLRSISTKRGRREMICLGSQREIPRPTRSFVESSGEATVENNQNHTQLPIAATWTPVAR